MTPSRMQTVARFAKPRIELEVRYAQKINW